MSIEKGINFSYPAYMITDLEYFDRERRARLAKQNLSLEEKFKILDSPYEEARMFGHFNNSDLLAGLDEVVRLAALLNVNTAHPQDPEKSAAGGVK